MFVNDQDTDLLMVRDKLQSLENKPIDSFKKNLIAISYLTFLLEKNNIRPFIVGGHAVELYTAGHYTTVDVDLVLVGREKAGELLEMVGFKKEDGRHWYHEGLRLPIEIPDQVLAGSEDKAIEIETEPGFKAFVIGVEDLIMDRLRAFIYWKSAGDRDWALSLLIAQWGLIDFSYLKDEATKETRITGLPQLEESLMEIIKEGQAFVK